MQINVYAGAYTDSYIHINIYTYMYTHKYSMKKCYRLTLANESIA